MKDNSDTVKPHCDYATLLQLKSTLMELGLIREQEYDWGTGYAITETGSSKHLCAKALEGTLGRHGEDAEDHDSGHGCTLLECLLREIRREG
jgi:hypothetical protein